MVAEAAAVAARAGLAERAVAQLAVEQLGEG